MEVFSPNQFIKSTIYTHHQKVIVNRSQRYLNICSEHTIKQLFEYIKNPKSNPEDAMLICLILFFGFTVEDLVFAQITNLHDSLGIILRRKPLSFGKKLESMKDILTTLLENE